MKKIATSMFLMVSSSLHAGTLIIDDFSYSQVAGSGASGGTLSEASDVSIFGGYRRILANGYVRFIIVGDQIEPGDSSGYSSISISEGSMTMSKSALTGSAFATYEGRAFTSGDRIGDLDLDISGGAFSLASPILWLEYTASITDQVISLSLSSAIDTLSSYDIPLAAGTTEAIIDLTKFAAVGNGALGGVNFSNIEEILIGLGNGDPVGEVQLKTFAFIPEPSSMILIGSGFLGLLLRRRKTQSEQAAAGDGDKPANLIGVLRAAARAQTFGHLVVNDTRLQLQTISQRIRERTTRHDQAKYPDRIQMVSDRSMLPTPRFEGCCL